METVVAGIIAFATTNIDDIFILTLFFSNPKYHVRYIVAGQFMGIVALTMVGYIGSFIGLVVDIQYIGLLGMIPVFIGIKSIVQLRHNDADEAETNIPLGSETMSNTFYQALAVAGVTIANGGDNISIYIPFFATLSNSGKITILLIFLIMTGLWCFVARYLSNHSIIKRSVEKYGHIITPFVFILLGIYIMYESKTFELFIKD